MRALLAVLLSVLVAGCASPRVAPPDASTSGEAPLERESFLLLPIEESAPFRLRATVASESGVPIDAWLLEGDACSPFAQPRYDATAGFLARDSGVVEMRTSAAKACLVLDNAADDWGGAHPSRDVNVTYTLDVWR